MREISGKVHLQIKSWYSIIRYNPRNRQTYQYTNIQTYKHTSDDGTGNEVNVYAGAETTNRQKEKNRHLACAIFYTNLGRCGRF